jgi:hypothetical protein
LLLFSCSVKNAIGILTLDSQIAFLNMAIFIILILILHEHGKSFHLLVFNFFLQCFMDFIAQVFQWTVFLISSSAYSLWLCRKATDFYMLTSCRATLLKVLIRSESFLMESLGSSGSGIGGPWDFKLRFLHLSHAPSPYLLSIGLYCKWIGIIWLLSLLFISLLFLSVALLLCLWILVL